jgi:LemA protein
VLHWNTRIQRIPSNVIAGMFNFGPRDYFQGDDENREPVHVQF